MALSSVASSCGSRATAAAHRPTAKAKTNKITRLGKPGASAVLCCVPSAQRPPYARQNSLSSLSQRRQRGCELFNEFSRTSSLVTTAGSLGDAATADPSASELLQVAKRTAAAGAKVVMAAVDKPKGVEHKGSELDLVTATDKASEDACLAAIRAEYPGHAILGEEGGVTGDTTSEYLWVIDPLDGTTNFSRGYPPFAVSVAVLKRGQPIAATVVEFVGGPYAWNTRTFTAHRNGGAFCDGNPISVSRVRSISRSLVVTGFGYDHGAAWAENFRLFKHFTDVSLGVRRLGSAAVDLCHVALGISDAYWEFNLKPWDVAAGVLIVEEAGGRVTTMNGCAYSVFDRTLLASNDGLWADVKAETSSAVTRLVSAGEELSPWYIPKGYNVHSGPISE